MRGSRHPAFPHRASSRTLARSAAVFLPLARPARLGGEYVIAHGGKGEIRVSGHVRRCSRLFQERLDLAVFPGIDDAELAGLTDRHLDSGHGGGSPTLDVLVEHLTGIHAVDVICAKNDHIVGLLISDQIEVLKDRIGRTGKPMGTAPHLGGYRGDVVTEDR